MPAPTASDVVNGNSCPGAFFNKTYCRKATSGIFAGGCESWECGESGGTYPNYENEWIWGDTIPETCEDAGYCDWIEESNSSSEYSTGATR